MHKQLIDDLEQETREYMDMLDALMKSMERLKAEKPNVYAVVAKTPNAKALLLNLSVLGAKARGYIANHSEQLPKAETNTKVPYGRKWLILTEVDYVLAADAKEAETIFTSCLESEVNRSTFGMAYQIKSMEQTT